jgi:UDP-glucose:(heptosyl)LPS alpha-1,3-glucosyltransferase
LSRIDVLLHPARFEPFGMVIAEANAAGIPCVISATCGIAPLLATDMGKVLPLEAEVDMWASALLPYLEKERPAVRSLDHFWPALAARHAAVYSAVLSEKGLSIL